MKEYYLKTGKRVKGPYLLDDLKYLSIDPNTLVRVDKDGQWAPISEDEDLSFLLKVQSNYGITEHNERNHSSTARQQKRPKSFIILAILILLLGMGVSIFVFLSPVAN